MRTKVLLSGLVRPQRTGTKRAKSEDGGRHICDVCHESMKGQPAVFALDLTQPIGEQCRRAHLSHFAGELADLIGDWKS